MVRVGKMQPSTQEKLLKLESAAISKDFHIRDQQFCKIVTHPARWQQQAAHFQLF